MSRPFRTETCRRGHPRSAVNTYVRPDGTAAFCRPCHAESQARYQRTAKGSAKHRARAREAYWTESGVRHARRRIRDRRNKALVRMAERHRGS